jgi:hypothetical protein
MVDTLHFDGTNAILLQCIKPPPKVTGQCNWKLANNYPSVPMPDGKTFIGLINKGRIGGMVHFQGRYFTSQEVCQYFQPMTI